MQDTYTNPTDSVTLTQQLLAFDTINPPGNEGACAAFLRGLLEKAGFRVESYEHAPGRTSLVASVGHPGGSPSLCFVGHLDTVPLGNAEWQRDPFAGDIHEGRLYGRGASDMKSGVAAFVTAARTRVNSLPPTA